MHYVTFYHPVNGASVRALINTIQGLIASGDGDVYLLLATPGGDVNEGILLFNTLRAMPINLTTHNVGNVDSIGNVVFLAGARRLINPNATFMWHGVAMETNAPAKFEISKVREFLGIIEAAHKRMAQSVAGCTTLTEGEVALLFQEASTKDATFAMTHGIVHEIADARLPEGAKLVTSPAA